MMRPSLLPCALSVLAISVFAGRVARAQPVSMPGRDAAAQLSEPNTGSTDKADVIFQQGNDLYRLKKYAEAEAKYEDALRLKKVHDIAANLGYAEMRQGKYREAAEHLDFAVRTWPPTGKQDKRQYAVERLAIVKREVATLTIQVAVSGAEVFVDGKSVGKTPLTGAVFVEPGNRTLEAKHSGHVDGRQVIEAAKGAEQTVTLALVAAPEAAVPTPTPTSGVAAGSATPPPSSSPSSLQPPPTDGVPSSSGPEPAILVVGGAAAGVALVAGIVFTAVSSGKAGDAEDHREALASSQGPAACTGSNVPGDCGALEDALGSKDTFANLALWSFVGAGVLGVSTAIYAFAAPKASQKTSIRVAPAVGERSGGVWLGGRW